nr:MAG TPA: hypothetical protein [Caudoviricetes sp.]
MAMIQSCKLFQPYNSPFVILGMSVSVNAL